MWRILTYGSLARARSTALDRAHCAMSGERRAGPGRGPAQRALGPGPANVGPSPSALLAKSPPLCKPKKKWENPQMLDLPAVIPTILQLLSDNPTLTLAQAAARVGIPRAKLEELLSRDANFKTRFHHILTLSGVTLPLLAKRVAEGLNAVHVARGEDGSYLTDIPDHSVRLRSVMIGSKLLDVVPRSRSEEKSLVKIEVRTNLGDRDEGEEDNSDVAVTITVPVSAAHGRRSSRRRSVHDVIDVTPK